MVTIADLQKLYGAPSGDESHHLLRKFIKQEGAGAKVFIDELPLPQDSLASILEGDNTSLAETLKVLESCASHSWVALSTLSLLDNTDEQLETPKNPFFTDDGFAKEIDFDVLVTCQKHIIQMPPSWSSCAEFKQHRSVCTS